VHWLCWPKRSLVFHFGEVFVHGVDDKVGEFWSVHHTDELVIIPRIVTNLQI